MADFSKEAAHWADLRDQLQGLANTIRAMDVKSAAHDDLASYIEVAISDADGMCALDLYDRGYAEARDRAISIWEMRRAEPRAGGISRADEKIAQAA